jgi:hypothetical protein
MITNIETLIRTIEKAKESTADHNKDVCNMANDIMTLKEVLSKTIKTMTEATLVISTLLELNDKDNIVKKERKEILVHLTTAITMAKIFMAQNKERDKILKMIKEHLKDDEITQDIEERIEKINKFEKEVDVEKELKAIQEKKKENDSLFKFTKEMLRQDTESN